MSLGLQATKRRISSVNSTKKITNAMGLVATSKLRILKKNLAATSKYADEVKLMIASLMKSIPEEKINEVFAMEKITSSRQIFVVVTSTLGLCGGYNYNIYKEIAPIIDKENDLIISIGRKGDVYFKNRGYHVDDTYVDYLSDFDYSKVDKLAKYLLFLFKSNKCKEIKLVYTHFKNQITFKPETISLFPFDKIIEENTFTYKELNMIVEPDPVTVLKRIMPLYLKSILYSRLSESLTSEYASRRNAMDSATDNAEEIVSKLQIEFNKARQAAITQEITEVVGGANAQK